jgi:hypothetical protein
VTFDDDEDRPDRPVPARRVAEQRWKTGEPWRVRERRVRRAKVGGLLLVAGAVALILSIVTSSPAIPSRDVAAVAASGSSYRILFYGCRGERLEDLALYPGTPPSAAVEFTEGSIWYIESEGAGLAGDVQLALGQTPAGFRTLVAFKGLPASPAVGRFTLVVRTNDQLVHFAFNASLVAGDSVVTETGRYALGTYEQDEAQACS